jgi:chemotaxis family two-component system response regulator Rcp1
MALEVLLVEDSPGDVRLTQEAFRDAGTRINLHVATDGVAAMTFLRRQGSHGQAPRPDFILLDLNLPKMDGRETLAQIKKDENLKVIRTIILTSSDADPDIRYCYQNHADCYVRKPTEWDGFDLIAKHVNDLWLGMALLPN